MRRIIPPLLPSGGVIGIVSPSWGGPGLLGDRYRRSIAALEEMGFAAIAMPHALGVSEARPWVSGTRAERLDDLHRAFADPMVGMVMSSIGGDHSADLLAELDLELIAKHPKPFCGYSDITSLLLGLHAATGMVTFYGPALLPEFGETGGPDAEMVDSWRRATGTPAPYGLVARSAWQAKEDRTATDEAGRPRKREAGEPRVALREGRASGRLLVGCLPTIRSIVGTRWEPAWEGAILGIEAPERPYGPPDADRDLIHLRNASILHGLAGLVVGRTVDWTEREIAEFHACVLESVRGTSYPVLAGVEFGHSSPMATLPIGIEATIDGVDLSIDEAAVHD